MSANAYSLLSIPAAQAHFQSAYMNGYPPHHQPYDHERYPIHSHSSPYMHSLHSDLTSRDSYFQDRRLSEPYGRTPTTISRHNYQAPPLDYTSHQGLAQNGIIRRDPAEHGSSSLRNLVDFDPRPPHAGWTPKEEVDEDIQSRELLGSNLNRTSPGSDLSLNPAPISPRDDSLSPGGPVPSNASASGSASSKSYSFVSLPGNAVRKRPRRRYDEIERLYACSWPDCTKAYGTLNHLNAHVSMQRHGAKRSPAEFKELRKQWRAQKKQEQSLTSSSLRSTPSVASQMRRRATEPNIALPRDHSLGHSASNPPHLSLNHRLSLGDLQYPEEDHLATSPSSTSPSEQYWQDSPLSSNYTLSLQSGQNPPSPPTLTPPNQMSMQRLGADSSLLTPLPGYRPSPPAAVPPISRLGPGSTLLQPLSAGTLANLSPAPATHTRSSGYNEFSHHSDTRPGTA